MKNLRHIFAVPCATLLAALTLASCRHIGAGDHDSVAEVAEECVEVSDTISSDTVPPRLTFRDSDEILSYMRESASAARYANGILPQMARTAPEYAEELLNNHHPRFVIADKGSMRVIVYDSCGVELQSFRMACGKNYGTKHKRRDCRTPEGLFSVEGIYNSTEWLYTDDDGNTSQVKGQFGPRFIRLRIPGTTQIGIHGTCAPWSVGGRRSHGCMRLNNDDIMTLVSLVEKGMPVIVNPSLRDQMVNLEEDSPVRRVYTGYPDRDEVKNEKSRETRASDTLTREVEHEEQVHSEPLYSPAEPATEGSAESERISSDSVSGEIKSPDTGQ